MTKAFWPDSERCSLGTRATVPWLASAAEWDPSAGSGAVPWNRSASGTGGGRGSQAPAAASRNPQGQVLDRKSLGHAVRPVQAAAERRPTSPPPPTLPTKGGDVFRAFSQARDTSAACSAAGVMILGELPEGVVAVTRRVRSRSGPGGISNIHRCSATFETRGRPRSYPQVPDSKRVGTLGVLAVRTSRLARRCRKKRLPRSMCAESPAASNAPDNRAQVQLSNS